MLRGLLADAGFDSGAPGERIGPARAGPAAYTLGAAVVAGALSCADARPPSRLSSAPRGAHTTPWRYEVVAGEGARELAIDVHIPEGPPRRLSVDDGAEPFVAEVTLVDGVVLRPIAPSASMWLTPTCPAAGCRLRYRFRLDDAADALDHPGYAARYGGAFVAPPSAWLLHPTGDEPAPASSSGTAVTFRLRVTAPEGIEFVTGLFPSASEPGAFEAPLADLAVVPYSAIGPLRVRRVTSSDAAVQIGILPGALDLGDDALAAWVAGAARSVSHYYGRFPVRRALVLLVPSRGSGIYGGSALGHGGASILARVGRGTTEDDLADDWHMTHEMIHLAFPNIGRRHAWLEEGLSTYVEPIARARMGALTTEKVWRDLVVNLPKGLPMPGDRGLDNTPTWGRTYWGGALFCLLADIEIRERTGDARSLDDALRGILAAGGDISANWTIQRALAEGDRSTGVPVLTALYDRMKDEPVDVDLELLWRRLGVSLGAGRVLFDDGAPLASIRGSITARTALAWK